MILFIDNPKLYIKENCLLTTLVFLKGIIVKTKYLKICISDLLF